MISNKDKIIEFIGTVQYCTREQIQEVYFKNTSVRYCNKCLKDLTDNKFIKRNYYSLNQYSNSYVYYIGRKLNKRMLKHDLLITDTMIKFMDKYSIKEITKTPKIEDVKPDALIIIRTGYKLLPILIEVQLSPNDCFKKYYNFAHKFKKYSGLDERPLLYVVTDLELQEIKLLDLNVVVDDLNMNKLRELIKIDKDFK